MKKNLVIVESPAKAKTIENYLGKDFEVKSSYGHVRDLPKKDNAIDVKNNFLPTYQITEDKKELVAGLKKLAKNAETIYLASDDDREGESISWHLAEALNLDEKKTKRIVFREITKKAIQTAIQNPRSIDTDLVNAQQARRVLDRLVGFELSPILWKKIQKGLSAGRVQSVAVRLVVEREREISKFVSVSSFKVVAKFELSNGIKMKAELPRRFKTEEEATAFLNKCKGAKFTIENIDKKPSEKAPAPPFTTSTLQQEASRKMGYPVARTMTVAQKLYEAGKISYMRTDSLNLSQDALDAASVAIHENYGKDYAHTRTYKSKNSLAQEAHEAIRPTDFKVQKAGNNDSEKKLYDLIWKRAIASQMANAKLEKTVVSIGVSSTEEKLVAKGEVTLFDGFLKVYIESTDEENKDDENTKRLPSLTLGQQLDLQEMLAKQIFTQSLPRYTEASLVKKLEEIGIGRPSTYAPTISTIQKRNYVEKRLQEGKERISIEYWLKKEKKEIEKIEVTELTGSDKNKLIPTNTAMVVNDFLVLHFPKIIDYHFTASVEQQFDDIAMGKIVWNKMISNFYADFHPIVEKTVDIERDVANQVRELGEDAKTGEKIYARYGKYGAYVQKGELVEGEKKPQYASLKKGQFVDTVTLEESFELFKLPREVGVFEKLPMTVAIGKYGPYVLHDKKFAALKKEQNPLTITDEEAKQLILEKRKIDKEKCIKIFDKKEPVIHVLKGRYGPYIKVGIKNVKIPKEQPPKELTYEMCLKIIKDAPVKKKRR